jgi:hypothetical protein
MAIGTYELVPGDLISIVALVVSVAAAGATIVTNLRGQRRQYFSEMRRWADAGCDQLSEAVHLCDLDPATSAVDFVACRHALRVSLSSLIDRGRWFFPNLRDHEVGVDRDKAYRGFRPPVLDELVAAYRLVGKLDPEGHASNAELREPLVSAKRRFSSEIQVYLDPRKREMKFTRMTEYRGDAPIEAESLRS